MTTMPAKLLYAEVTDCLTVRAVLDALQARCLHDITRTNELLTMQPDRKMQKRLETRKRELETAQKVLADYWKKEINRELKLLDTGNDG